MTRRWFIFRKPSQATSPSPPPVVDIDRLNSFADIYNSYVASLQRGKLDLTKWASVLEGWKRLIQ